MNYNQALKMPAMMIIGTLISLPAVQAAPPDATLEKLLDKKEDQLQKELDRGSEQGQLARENRQKWWIFDGGDTEEPPPFPEEPATPPEEEEPRRFRKRASLCPLSSIDLQHTPVQSSARHPAGVFLHTTSNPKWWQQTEWRSIP